MPHDFFHGRHAGLLVPLFSIPSRESWGIGEIPDIIRIGRWMREAGFCFLQLLPLNEMAEGQNSPYSALSAMAFDPLFIAPSRVPDVEALGGEAALTTDERASLHAARNAADIQYPAVRAIKNRIFRTAFDRFMSDEWRTHSHRAARLTEFIQRERWWLDDYTLFRAIHACEDGRHWRDWDPGVRDRHPQALAQAREELAGERLFYAYLQWLAADQWAEAREQSGVGLFGDFPFMVSGDSADVWSRQDDFRLDASVGAPPDAFSETGQDWGFPAYRWSKIAAEGDAWLVARARHSVTLYDGYRVDHLVGFFRTYVREQDGSAAFVPPDEPSQIAQGERLLTLFGSTGARVIAEDLGLIPKFVRATLNRTGVPGYKVLRWEREWDEPGKPFRDPSSYPSLSVATSGTHDTETLAEWWDTAPAEERRAVAALPSFRGAGFHASDAFSDKIRDAILGALLESGSSIALLPIQDIFGWRDRINTPALISDVNWCWRLPWAVEDLLTEPQACERAAFLRALATASRRLPQASAVEESAPDSREPATDSR
jgi:4-alpha-glucanotransferase